MKAKILFPFLCLGALTLCSCGEKPEVDDPLCEQALREMDCGSIPVETAKKVVGNIFKVVRGEKVSHPMTIGSINIVAYDADQGVATYSPGIDGQTQEPVTEELPILFFRAADKEILLDYAQRGKLDEIAVQGIIDKDNKCLACLRVDAWKKDLLPDTRDEEAAGDDDITLSPDAALSTRDQEQGVRLAEALLGIESGNVAKVLVGDEKLGREDAQLMVEEVYRAMRGAALTVTKGAPEKFTTLPHSLVAVEFILVEGSAVALLMHYPDTDLYYMPDPDGCHIRIAASQRVSDLLHRVVAASSSSSVAKKVPLSPNHSSSPSR